MILKSMKSKLLIFLPISLLLFLFLFFLPRFYFNELEFKGREKFSEIEEARQIADENIEQRSGREGGTKTYQEIENISIDIAADLGKVVFFVDEHESILKKQNIISFLLPSKYKEFLKLKNEVFDKYYSSLRKFKSLKDYESGIMKMFILEDELSMALGESSRWEELEELVNKLTGYRDSIKKYYEDGFMTKDFYEASLAEINTDIELYNLLVDGAKNNYSVEEASEKVKEIYNKYSLERDFSDIYMDSYTEITIVKQKEWSNLFNEADELTITALEYYETGGLAFDPLSVLISKFNENYPKNTTLQNSGFAIDQKRIDLDGDGEDEILNLAYTNNEEESFEVKSLIAYDQEGKEIARYPEDLIQIPVPMSDSAKAHKLDKSNNKETVSYDFIAGPHSSHTLFVGLREYKGEKILLPTCFVESPENIFDCLFWSGEVGSLVAQDLDNDGFMEMVEIVDEYPKDGSITSDIKVTIDETFKDSGQDVIDDMIRIAKREQGGRGDKVVWGIYRYNGEYFEPQLGSDYEKYYPLVTTYLRQLNKDYPEIMKKSEMSKDSLDYNEFIRNFWTNGN